MNSKLLTIITAVLSVVGIILFVLVATAGDLPEDVSGPVANIVNFAIFVFIIAILAAVLGSLFGLFKNPAALKKTFLGLVVLGGLLLVSYLIANGSEVVDVNNKILAAKDSSVSRLTSTGIWISTLLLLISGVFFIWDLLKGIIKS